MDWLWFILIGLVIGWVASLIVKGRGSGFLINILVGIVGAVIGGYIFRILGVNVAGLWGSLLSALAGAVILLLLASLLMGKRKQKA